MAVLRSYKDFEMSVSQVVPEEVIPENPEVTSSKVVPAEPEARRLVPINLKKIVRIGGLGFLIVSLVGSVATIVIMAQQISDLSIRVNSLDAAFRSGQMSQLSGSVTSLEAQSRKHEKQLESVSSGLESVQNQLADFQGEHSKLTGSINKLSSEALARRTAIDEHSERIDDINSRLSQVESRVAGLSKAESNTSQKESKQNQQPVTKSKTSSKSGTGQIVKKPERSVRRAAVEAPFVLTGIERRGGQMFAVVIPRGNSQISDMRLLSPGDGMLGWTLRSIQDSGTAVFSVNGTQHSLQVQ